VLVGLVPKPDFLQPDLLLGPFGPDPMVARQRYLGFAEERLELDRVA
jgi:hypothetical protein